MTEPNFTRRRFLFGLAAVPLVVPAVTRFVMPRWRPAVTWFAGDLVSNQDGQIIGVCDGHGAVLVRGNRYGLVAGTTIPLPADARKTTWDDMGLSYQGHPDYETPVSSERAWDDATFLMRDPDAQVHEWGYRHTRTEQLIADGLTPAGLRRIGRPT